MKISTKKLAAFNAGRESAFNENYNESLGLPTLVEYNFLRRIASDKWGMRSNWKNLTQKIIKDWLSYNTFKPSEAMLKHAQRQGISL